MKYYKNTAGDVFAYETEQEREKYGSPDLVRMTPQEVQEHLNPTSTYQQELTALNAEWQAKVESYNKSFALAALADGPSEEVKKAAIRAAYEADKMQNAEDRNALKVKHGLGGV